MVQCAGCTSVMGTSETSFTHVLKIDFPPKTHLAYSSDSFAMYFNKIYTDIFAFRCIDCDFFNKGVGVYVDVFLTRWS